MALGVFLGGSALLLATCGVLGVAGHAAMKQQERAGEALARQMYPEVPMAEVRNKREAADFDGGNRFAGALERGAVVAQPQQQC